MTKDALIEKVAALAGQMDFQVSILLRRMDEEEPILGIDTDRETVAASTIKLMVLLCLLEDVHARRLDLAEIIFVEQCAILPDSIPFEGGARPASLEELARWMMMVSDNTSTNILIDRLGMARIQKSCDTLGLAHTKLQRLMLVGNAAALRRENYITARDLDTIFTHLYEKHVLTPALCEWAMNLLKACRDTALFLRYIPHNLEIAHKVGGLPGLRHDAGIFYCPQGDYFLAILISQAFLDAACEAFVGTVSKYIYEYMYMSI